MIEYFPSHEFKFPRGKTLRVSIQAGEFFYSHPREDHPNLSDFTAVEVGILLDGEFLKPSEVGVEGFDEIWMDEEVGGYCPTIKVFELLAALRALYGPSVEVPTVQDAE